MSGVAPFGLPRGKVGLQWLVIFEWLGSSHEAVEGDFGNPDQVGLAKECSSDGLSPQKRG
jgi:hypothetical protein